MSDTPKKTCTGPCGQEYDATTEFFHRNGESGLYPKCKECKNKVQKAYADKTGEYRSAKMKDYRERPEIKKRLRTQNKLYKRRPYVRAKNILYNRAYHRIEENRKRNLIKGKERRAIPEIKEHTRIRMKGYNSRTKEQRRAYWHAYYNLPEKRAMAIARSRTRQIRKKEISGTYTPEQIQDQLKRQKCKCYYCQKRFQKVKGKHIYHIEHTFPLSRVAGSDIPANDISYLVLACPACNWSKGDKFPWEWAEGGRLC